MSPESGRPSKTKLITSAKGNRVAGQKVPAPIGPKGQLRGTRLWLLRFGLLVLTPLLVLTFVEGALRIFNYGYPVSFFVKSEWSDNLITNQEFAWQFFSKKTVLRPFLFTLPRTKTPGTVRIGILGESAAMGTPDPAFSFGRILDAMLRRQYPDSRFEVLNVAMRGINSHAIRLIAQECARHQIDIFIIYMGNNEMVGLHAPTPRSPDWAQSLSLIRVGQWARRTKLGQLITGVLLPPADPHAQTMEHFREVRMRADDGRCQKVRENFRVNLEDILHDVCGAQAKVILCTVGANLKDFPPLASLHRAGLAGADADRWDSIYRSGMQLEANRQFDEALRQYLAAAELDDHFAELHFHLARCYWALQDWEEAKKHFGLARDWDAMQFRTDSRVNEIIRNTAAPHRKDGVVLLDMEKAFSASELSDHGLPGEKLFCDHVHPTFAGDYLLARECYGALIPAIGGRLAERPRAEIPTAQQCAEDIAYTVYDDLNVNAAMVRLTAGPPFLDQLDHLQRQAAAESDNQKRLAAFDSRQAKATLDTYLAALSRRSDDWPIHFNLALFCEELKWDSRAAQEFEYLAHRFPQTKNFRVGWARSLLNSGNRVEALAQFQAALRLDPGDKDLRQEVQQLTRAGVVR